MAEGQRKRQIGKGMKARGTKRVKPQKEVKEVTDQSTTEGQQIPVPEAVLKVEEGNKTPGNLEPENGEKSLQNLENSEAIVAHDDGLEAALKESGASEEPQFTVQPIPGREFSDLTGPSLDQIARAIYENGKPQLQETIVEGKKYSIGIDTGAGEDRTVVMVPHGASSGHDIKVEGDAVKFFASALGPQTDGTYGVAVSIPEGIFDPVSELAKDRGITIERWCNEFFQEALDAYFSPAGKR